MEQSSTDKETQYVSTLLRIISTYNTYIKSKFDEQIALKNLNNEKQIDITFKTREIKRITEIKKEIEAHYKGETPLSKHFSILIINGIEKENIAVIEKEIEEIISILNNVKAKYTST